jgi:nitronate monooxygenase
MPAALDVRSLDAPIVQAGMGAVARHELAAAVSEAGGLGTIAGARAPIAAAHRLTGRPIAVNLLLPFVRSGDAEASAAADVIVTFWGTPRRLAANTWIHQCGSVEEATAAAAAGADAVIAQGVEAGGHVRGSTPMLELLERVRAAVKIPVLAAGGIIDAEGVRAALDGGAVAAVAGTRFLLSDESHAHPDYKQRCLDASETILTELFGLGWPGAPHRVIPNGARRTAGCAATPVVPNGSGRRTVSPLRSRAGSRPLCRTARSGPSVRLNPSSGHNRPPTTGPVNLVDSGPLYAGVNVPRVADIRPAGELVKALTP